MAGKAVYLRLNRNFVATAVLIIAAPAERMRKCRCRWPRPPSDFPRTMLRPTMAKPFRFAASVPVSPVNIAEYTEAIIQDATEQDSRFRAHTTSWDRFGPDRIFEITGTIAERAGLPVLQVKRLYVVDDASLPALQLLTISSSTNVDVTGRFVRTEGSRSRGSAKIWAAMLMELSDGGSSILVFHPFEGPERLHAFTRFRTGDRVAVKGISGQYCPAPPFNRSFEIVIGSSGAVQLVSRAWIVPPQVAAVLLLLLIAALGGWFWRERKLKRQRHRQSAIMTLGEDIIGAANLAEIARLMRTYRPGEHRWSAD